MEWTREAMAVLPPLIEGWLQRSVEITSGPQPLLLRAGDRQFLVAARGSDDVAAIERAAHHLDSVQASPHTVKLVTVPYMGPKARAWAEQRGVSWVDLSGNAAIRADGLCIVVSGQRNRYARPGRPSNPFTPRYSRLSRALLAQPDRWWKQVQLHQETGLPSGTVSKAVRHLDALDLLERDGVGAIRTRTPSLLLDSWAQRYRFSDHTLRRYHMTAQSGEEALHSLAERLTEHGLMFAATGLSGAWLTTAFADFRLNTFLVDKHPARPEALGLRPVDRGENVWLAVPHDEGAFYQRSKRGTWCAHPVQVYLDLLGHPERAADAARELRAQELSWSR